MNSVSMIYASRFRTSDKGAYVRLYSCITTHYRIRYGTRFRGWRRSLARDAVSLEKRLALLAVRAPLSGSRLAALRDRLAGRADRRDGKPEELQRSGRTLRSPPALGV